MFIQPVGNLSIHVFIDLVYFPNVVNNIIKNGNKVCIPPLSLPLKQVGTLYRKRKNHCGEAGEALPVYSVVFHQPVLRP